MSKCFLDTNVIVYSYDDREPAKRVRAADLVAALVDAGAAVISTQVIQEFASVALTKLDLSLDAARQAVGMLGSLHIVTITPDVVCRAISLRERHRLNYWDACIVAAAEDAGCAVLYSEDFRPGPLLGDLQVVNPFA
jgi:predicted nucleic acid-binding protein